MREANVPSSVRQKLSHVINLEKYAQAWGFLNLSSQADSGEDTALALPVGSQKMSKTGKSGINFEKRIFGDGPILKDLSGLRSIFGSCAIACAYGPQVVDLLDPLEVEKLVLQSLVIPVIL